MPRTDTVLADPRLGEAIGRLGRARVKEAVSRAQEQARSGQISPDAVADAAVAGLPGAATSLLPVLNATGVLLHTNLGRAPLSAAAVAAMAAAAGYTDLEFDLDTGTRGRRGRGTLAALSAAVPAGGGGARGEQQRGRAGAGGHRAGGRPGDRGQPGRDDRDRRRVPAA